jgi:hypothetical protein
MTDERFIKGNEDYLVTKTTIDPKVSLETLKSVLKERKTNGELRVKLVNGSIRFILLHESTRAEETDRDGIRKIFGMNGN